MSETIAVDGELLGSEKIMIDFDSWGLAYGYGVFETIKVREGRLCFFSEHCSRFADSCRAMELELLFDEKELRRQAMAVIVANEAMETGLKMICVRQGGSTTVLIHLRDGGSQESGGLALRLSTFTRSSQSIAGRHKTTNYLENLLQLKEAQSRGYDECVFLNERECLTECCTANLFFAKDGRLKTPSLDCGLLDGVVRRELIRIAEEKALLVEEGRFRVEELEDADEVFITNSLRGVCSVNRIHFYSSSERFYEGALAKALADDLMKRERSSY